ncbi:MAG: hypothetical protein PF517_08335 [Salinivirgaceae bacterium]|nr:hypothetical protein [Salinivirgaceae bacterium]
MQPPLDSKKYNNEQEPYEIMDSHLGDINVFRIDFKGKNDIYKPEFWSILPLNDLFHAIPIFRCNLILNNYLNQ